MTLHWLKHESSFPFSCQGHGLCDEHRRELSEVKSASVLLISRCPCKLRCQYIVDSFVDSDPPASSSRPAVCFFCAALTATFLASPAFSAVTKCRFLVLNLIFIAGLSSFKCLWCRDVEQPKHLDPSSAPGCLRYYVYTCLLPVVSSNRCHGLGSSTAGGTCWRRWRHMAIQDTKTCNAKACPGIHLA